MGESNLVREEVGDKGDHGCVDGGAADSLDEACDQTVDDKEHLVAVRDEVAESVEEQSGAHEEEADERGVSPTVFGDECLGDVVGADEVAEAHAAHDEAREVLGNVAALHLEREDGREEGELEVDDDKAKYHGEDLSAPYNYYQ